jgi:probable F420-dependent oxidoreductase
VRFSVGLPVDQVDHPEEFVTASAVAEMAAAAEEAGYDACFVTDHPAPDAKWLANGGHHALEPTVSLAFAAAATSTLHLHTHIYVAAYRNPFLAAKSVLTLDALSGGRVILGVGAGYLRAEFNALGVDFDARNELLEESLAVMRRAWTEDAVAVDGHGFHARGVTMRPRLDKPAGTTIWIGGNSTRAAEHAVESAEGWSPFPNQPLLAKTAKTAAITNIEELGARIEAAKAYAREIGRTEPLEVCFAAFDQRDDPSRYEEVGVTWQTVGFHGVASRREWLDRMHDFAERWID